MSDKKKDLELKTGLNPQYAQKILVRDIDCKESLLDLIDNSIDSARSAILSGGGEVDARGMPVSYSGYEINVGIDKKKEAIYIEDTCSGIELSAMRDRFLVIGEESNAPFAIGHFGVGLKRALLKLGRTYRIETSYINETYLIECTAQDLTESSRKVFAKHIESKQPSSYTQIRILDVSDEAMREIFRSNIWEHNVSKEIGMRYSIFIKKGLVIKYKNVPIKAYCPGLREYKSIKLQEDDIGDVPHGIKVHIRAGLHENYKFKGEGEENTAKENEKITGEYGWYYVCNDRVIKIACKDSKFGWAGKWHPEYYGFVGWVYFTGNVKDLPWNTKKTDIDPDSDVFSAIKGYLQNYASKYRTHNRTLKKKLEVGLKIEDAVNPKQLDMLGPDIIDQRLDVQIESSRTGSPALNIREDKKAPSDQEKVESSNNLWIDGGNKYRPKTKIIKSLAIVEKLEELGSQKLSQLYNSLYSVSLVEHPVLMSVGSWSFFETLSKLSGATTGTSFSSYFNGKINEWYTSDRERKNAFKRVLSDLSERGNLDKHESEYYTVDARQLVVDFNVTEPLILKILDEIIKEKKA